MFEKAGSIMVQSEIVQHAKRRWDGTNRTCIFKLLSFSMLLNAAGVIRAQSHAPYSPSPVIRAISWLWETRQAAAIGSDLWPVTWGPDNHLYAAWGDGGGFGGSDSDGRVAMGIARIEGEPDHWRGLNINGGKNPEHPASFLKKGKT